MTQAKKDIGARVHTLIAGVGSWVYNTVASRVQDSPQRYRSKLETQPRSNYDCQLEIQVPKLAGDLDLQWNERMCDMYQGPCLLETDATLEDRTACPIYRHTQELLEQIKPYPVK